VELGSTGGARRDSRRSPAPWIIAALVVLPWILVVATLWVSYTFPVKQDRYGHAFRSQLTNRAVAYWRLLRSPEKFANKRLPLERIQKLVDEAAARHGVDRCLAQAVVAYESAYWPNAISTTGAMGLMAIMPKTAEMLEVRDPFDPAENVDGGVRLLRDLLAAVEGDVERAIAAYNAGLPKILAAGGVPRIRETRDYVSHVNWLRNLCRGSAAPTLYAADPSR
jgi:soluble lytic murein transglycosylase-like protein